MFKNYFWKEKSPQQYKTQEGQEVMEDERELKPAERGKKAPGRGELLQSAVIWERWLWRLLLILLQDWPCEITSLEKEREGSFYEDSRGGGLMQPAWHRIQSTSPARCFAQKREGTGGLSAQKGLVLEIYKEKVKRKRRASSRHLGNPNESPRPFYK